MTKHTPEPWHYVADPEGKFGIYPEGGKFLAITDHEANANRIVACVNACKGINPEAVKELLEALKLAEAHLDFCGWGDEYERKGARSHKLPGIIATAIAKAEGP